MLAQDNFCEACGERLRPRSSAGADGGPALWAATCGTCGARNISADGYCGKCGRLQPRARDHFELDVGGAAGVSDRGLRHHRNEDALALRRLHAAKDGIAATVVVVCDGVSAAPQADEASSVAVEAGAEAIVAALVAGEEPEAATHHGVESALAAVVRLTASERFRSAPACTYVSAVVTDAFVTVGSVGDSRAYWVPQGGHEASAPMRLTEDDSWAAERLDPAIDTETEQWGAHAITAWLGADADELDPHIVTFEPNVPGIVVVCTDGLWNYLDSAEDLAASLPAAAAAYPHEAARELLRVALESGGRDNVTVAVVPFFTTGEGVVS